MKTVFKLTLIIQIILFVSSCGPNAEEKSRIQKIHDDSLKFAAESDMKRKMEEKESIEKSKWYAAYPGNF